MAGKNQLSTNLGLSTLPEIDQKEHPSIWVELLRMRNALGTLQIALDTYTGALSEDKQYWPSTAPSASTRLQNIARLYCLSDDTISVGQVVNVRNVAGTLTARRADGTNSTKPIHAFCITTAGVAAGAYGEFCLLGVNPYYAGLTPGSYYYLHTTAGQISINAPATPGNYVQRAGFALSSTELLFNPELTGVTV